MRIAPAAETLARGFAVFWWFKRRDDLLRYEARHLPAGGFELRIVDPDGHERVETFDDDDALMRRQVEFERQLRDGGWTGPHGWNM
jgi:hypothetical protein